MITLNKTIISVLVYAESTPDTIQLKHLYIFNYSETFRIIKVYNKKGVVVMFCDLNFMKNFRT